VTLDEMPKMPWVFVPYRGGFESHGKLVDAAGDTFLLDVPAAIGHLLAAAPDCKAELKRAAGMLAAVAGDIEDGYSIDSLRGKYLMAVVNARDDARAVMKRMDGGG